MSVGFKQYVSYVDIAYSTVSFLFRVFLNEYPLYGPNEDFAILDGRKGFRWVVLEALFITFSPKPCYKKDHIASAVGN